MMIDHDAAVCITFCDALLLLHPREVELLKTCTVNVIDLQVATHLLTEYYTVCIVCWILFDENI